MEDQLEEDKLEDMICDVSVGAFAQAHVYETMSTNS